VLTQRSKTQDVLDFVYQFQGSHISVFWIHAGSKLRFEQDYRKLAILVGLPGHDSKQDIRPTVKDWFEGPSSGDWVIVLDNADNELDFFLNETVTCTGTVDNDGLATYLPHGTKGTIIVTTRDYAVADRLAGMNTVQKEAMDREEAIELFLQRCPRAAEHEHDESISLLLKALQYLPHAIVQVGDCLRLNRLFSPSIYLKQFNCMRVSQEHLLSKSFITDLRRDSSAETVLTTFTISFRQIQEQSPLASSLLHIIACIDYQGIPYELLSHCGLEGSDDEFALKEALSKLINFSLLSPVQSNKAYEMHSLVHASIQAFQSQEEMRTALEHATKALARILPDGKYRYHAMWRTYLPHAAIVTRKANAQSLDMATIHYLMSYYLLLAGNYPKALYSAQQSVMVRIDMLGQEHPDTLRSMSILASTYHSQGRWKEAEELKMQVKETTKRVLGHEHPTTLISMNNLALTYLSQGRWKEAEDLMMQVMETTKRVLGQEHPDTLASMHNLASTYQSQGRWKEAEELMMQVMETRKRVHGQEYPDILTSMNTLASTYQSQGRWKEAEELKMQVMETTKRVLGQEHPNTLTSMHHLASTYQSQERWKEAEELMMQVMETAKRVLGREHPDTLTSMHNLASTYQSQGRWKEAEELMMQVMETRKRVHGQEHPDTLGSIHNLALTYLSQGRWKEAQELMMK